MDQNLNQCGIRDVIEPKSFLNKSSNVKDQSNLLLVDQLKIPPLTDLSSINKEKLNAIEKAQKKWVADAKNWSTTDEIQKAQLEWIQKFSSVPHFNTINSPEKKKGTPWTLPFSPPRSSYDISPRRGYCVYKPGTRDQKNLSESISQHGNVIRIAQLEEPTKVSNLTSEKPRISTVFSPFKDAKCNKDIITKIDKSAKKRHITIRKKLQCLKKLEKDEAAKEQHNVESMQKAKSGNTPDKSEEERRAARKYIQRKRVERERQLREQRELEVRTEQEQKARMERLRETQHRILTNSTRRQPKQQQQQKKKEGWISFVEKELEDNKPISREMTEPPEYTRPHISGAIPFLSSRREQNSCDKDSKSTPLTPTAGFQWTQDENVPPPQEDALLALLECGQATVAQPLSSIGKASSTKINTLSDTRQSSETSIPLRLKSLPLQKPVNPTLSSTPIGGSKFSSSESLALRSSPESAYFLTNSELLMAQSPATRDQPITDHNLLEPICMEDAQ